MFIHSPFFVTIKNSKYLRFFLLSTSNIEYKVIIETEN